MRRIFLIEEESVSKYSSMLCLHRLSGLSPFAGDNDIETLKNVKACDWDFDEEAFRDVSEEGKDFIRRLLIKNKEYYLHYILYLENLSNLSIIRPRLPGSA